MKRFANKVLLPLVVGILASFPLAAQLSFGGTPQDAPETLRSAKAVELAVPFNRADLVATSEWNEGMMKVGEVLNAPMDFFEEAECFTSSSGTVCYRLTLSARDARGLSVAFSRFDLPEGGRFFVSNSRQVLGAFTKESNPDGGFFATAPLCGSTVQLQYEAPNGNPPASIELDHLGYLFRAEGVALRDLEKEGSSTLCEVNVNCPEGDHTRQQQDAVVHIYCKIGNSYAYCTGTVVNNTDEDFTPYVLTAAHCGGVTRPLSAFDYKAWVFTFHYEKPQCQNNYQLATKYLTLSGCEMVSFLSTEGKSDGLLLKLSSPIPSYYGVYYAGWDRSEAVGEKHIGLHHPNGDVMKVSTSRERPHIVTYGDATHKGGSDAYLHVEYQKTPNGHGVTEGGSSGSPLFNEEGLLVGTLTGGASSCSFPAGSNIYGRMAYHWDKFPAVGTSVALALDPKGQGEATKLQGRYQADPSAVLVQPLQNLKVETAYVASQQKVTFSWSLPNLGITDSGFKLYIWKEAGTSPIATLPLSVNKWEDVIEGNESGTTLYTFRYGYAPTESATPILFSPRRVALLSQQPRGVREIKQVESQGKTKLSWKRPVNFQRVTNIAPDATQFIRLDDYRDGSEPYFEKPIKTIYTGSLFNGVELQPLVGKKIVSIGFVTARGNLIHKYSVFVREGIHVLPEKSYSIGDDTAETFTQQPFVGNYNELEKKEVALDKPFSIKGNDLLVVGLKTETETNFKSRAVTAAKSGLPTALRNAVANHDIRSGTKLPYYDTNRWYPYAECFPKQDGLSTTSFVLCDALDDEKIDIPEEIPYGSFPILFPVLKGYKIVQDGKEIATLSDPTAEEYLVSGAGHYAVIPLYEGYQDGASDTEAIAPLQRPVAYPSYFREEITLEGGSALTEALVYAIDGTLVEKVTLNAHRKKQTIQLANLSSGEYILVLQDRHGETFVQRIFKR